MPFLVLALLQAQSPSRLSGKGSNAQKAGTPDAGPSGPAAPRVAMQPSVQFPAGSERKRGYTEFGRKGKADGPFQAPAAALPPLDRAGIAVS